MADQFVKNEDGAESYGCTVNYIPHHPPELIIKANGREQERLRLFELFDLVVELIHVIEERKVLVLRVDKRLRV